LSNRQVVISFGMYKAVFESVNTAL